MRDPAGKRWHEVIIWFHRGADRSSSLIYLCATTILFLSRDPVTGFMGRAMSFNGYSYTEGNPVNYTDSSGTCVGPLLVVCVYGTKILIGAAVGAVVGAGVIGSIASPGFVITVDSIRLAFTRNDIVVVLALLLLSFVCFYVLISLFQAIKQAQYSNHS